MTGPKKYCVHGAIVSLALLLSALADPSQAQDPAPGAGQAAQPATSRTGKGIEELVVTARRRKENVQKVPVAITALSATTLRQQNITTALDLPRVAPGLNVAAGSAGGQGTPQITLRGQRQGNFGPSYDPSVGVYLGDIVWEVPIGFSQSLFDLANVQVLKGPQGTLFGRNTTGGAILFQPQSPTDRYTADIHTSLGNYDLHEVDGNVNIPISDKLQLRIAGQHEDRAGYIHDYTTGQDDQNENESAFRVSLRYKPTDDIESVTVGNYITRNTNPSGYKFLAAVPGGTVAAIYGPAIAQAVAQTQALGFYGIASGTFQPGFSSLHTGTIANTTSYHLNDAITLKNIIGYVHSYASQIDDQDGSPLPIVTFGDTEELDQFTEEAQVLGKAYHLNWILGAYYFREGATYPAPAYQVIEPVLRGTITPDITNENDINTSRSVFGSGTYDFSDYVPKLSATFGGRYTWDNRDSRFGTTYALGLPNQYCAYSFSPTPVRYTPAPSCQTHREASFSQFTYNVDIDYALASDKLVYFAHRLGYRTGGFNVQATTADELKPFLPETVNDYELGAKLDWHFAGMYLRTNAAIYLEDYANIQRLVTISIPNPNGKGSTIGANIVNAASATINGAEVEATFIPRDDVQITAFVNQIQPEYNKFLNTDSNGTTTDISKTAPFAGFPKTAFGVTGRYTLPVPDQYGTAVLQVNYYHQSSFIQTDAVAPRLYSEIPSYGLLNFRAEWNNVMASNFSLAGFVNNALDNRYIQNTATSVATLGYASTIAAPPLMFGFEASYHFGS